eukprot:gene6066-10074_t
MYEAALLQQNVLVDLTNVTQLIAVPSGGILTTLYINAFLCAIMFLIFVGFIIHLPLFNVKEKKRLERRITRDMEYIHYGKVLSPPIFPQKQSIFTTIKEIFFILLNSMFACSPCCPTESKKEFQRMVKTYGKEATVYSLFLKELLFAFFVCGFVASAILFPLHLTGSVPPSLAYQVNGINVTQEESFIFKTTASMVLETPWKLYFHVALTYFFVFVFGFATFKYFSLIFYFKTDDLTERAYSVKVYGLPKDLSDSELKNIFEQMYPDKLISCDVTWDFIEGMKIKEKLDKSISNLDHSKYLAYLDDEKPKKILWKKFKSVDAIDYYDNEFKELSEKAKEWQIEYEKAKSGEETKLKSKRTAHIIFKDAADRNHCIDSYSKNILKVIKRQVSKKNLESQDEKPDFQLKVTVPNDPGDILWKNYLTRKFYDYLREFLGHGFMIIVCLFFTTPIALLSAIETLIKLPLVSDFVIILRSLTGELGNLLFQYLPTLLVTILSSLFSTIVIFITNLAKYKTKSKYNRMIIFRMYSYLILGVFIVPTLTLSSVDGVVKYFSSADSFNSMLSQLFVPSNGSFFINLILQFATFKSFMSLLILGPLFKFLFFYFMAKTPKQTLDATESAQLYFPLEYSYTLLIICIGLCYSLLSPIIIPAVLLYFILKYSTNRILMYFVFGRKLNPQMKDIDYTSIFEESWLISKIMFYNLIIFVVFHAVYFGLKMTKDFIYISHFVLEILLALGLVIIYFVLISFRNVILAFFLRVKHEPLDKNDQRITRYLPDLNFEFHENRKLGKKLVFDYENLETLPTQILAFAARVKEEDELIRLLSVEQKVILKDYVKECYIFLKEELDGNPHSPEEIKAKCLELEIRVNDIFSTIVMSKEEEIEAFLLDESKEEIKKEESKEEISEETIEKENTKSMEVIEDHDNIEMKEQSKETVEEKQETMTESSEREKLIEE